MTKISTVGVLGCGLMGNGIAQVAAAAGYTTLVREVAQPLLDKGKASIIKSLDKFVEKGKIDRGRPRRDAGPAHLHDRSRRSQGL